MGHDAKSPIFKLVNAVFGEEGCKKTYWKLVKTCLGKR